MKNGRFTSKDQKHKSKEWLWALSAFCLMLSFAPVRGQDLWSSGANTYGQLANGTKTELDALTKVDSTGTWTLIRGGSYFFIGQKSDGSLWSCGNNTYGQLGYIANTTTPTQIGTSTDWKTISASTSNSSYAPKASLSSGIANGSGEGSLAINYDQASASISISGTQTSVQVIGSNLQGQLLLDAKLGSGSMLPANGLSKGIYLVKAKSESAFTSKKVVIR